MSDPLQKLQTSLAEMLKDIMSMSASVIKKSNTYLTDVGSLRQETFGAVSTNIENLFDRINTNLTSFRSTFETAISDYQQSASQSESSQVAVSPNNTQNPNLSQNGSTQETDIDLTNSDEGEAESEKNKENGEQVATQNGDKNDSKCDEVESGSDTDSEKTVRNFDVAVTNGSVGDGDGSEDELIKALDELDKKDETTDEPAKEKQIEETESFDFDDLDEDLIIAELEKYEKAQGKSSDTSREQIRKDNHELLDLLNKAIGDDPMTEEDGDEALKILENEFSLSSATDSDESMKALSQSEDNDSSDDWKPTTHWKKGQSETEGSLSDAESLAEEEENEPEYQLKTFDLKLNRLDEMDDAAIESLCNTHTINKRKCVKDIRKFKKKKRKRIRVISSSSSSSDSSDLDDSTPDLVMDEDREPSPSIPNIELPDVTALADELVELLDKEDDDDDDDDIDIDIDNSDTISDLDSEEKKDENKEEDKIEDATEIEEIQSEDESQEAIKKEKEEEVPKPEKKRGSWRNEIFFDTSSESEDEDEPVVVVNDPLGEKVDEDEEEDKEKWKLTTKIKTDGEAVVIMDSGDSNSDSDEVTFIDEVTTDESLGKGRRNIRAILSDNELNELTQKAKSEEDERIQRIEEHSRNVETVQSQREDFVLDVDVKTGNPLVTVNYQLAQMLKPHQKDGVKFMWEACYESVDILKTKSGTGCILAHCMGLGKTLQIITLIHTLFTHSVTQTKHVLITCPLTTVTNWRNEFKKAFRQLNDSGIRRYFIVKGDILQKINTVCWWRQHGGVLVMGYEAFQKLVSEKMPPRVSAEQKKEVLEALTDPGPDLIVCDEGHLLKNSKTLKFMALTGVKTKRRIVLTGTPLQNNLKEYYVMVSFVKPHLLGTKKEYKNRFATPIENGQYHDSTPEDIKLMKKRTHVLTKLLKKTIHRAEAAILSSYLPEIVDYTVCLKLTPLQMEMYTQYINMSLAQRSELGKTLLADVMMLNFNNLHPYTIQLYHKKPKPKKKKRKRTDEGTAEDDEQEADASHVSQDWFQVSLPEDVACNLNYSAKLKLVFDIVNECIRLGEKVLIFVQFLVELDTLENFLKTCGTTNQRIWRPNVDYYRMDGKTPIDDRDILCRKFNTDPTAKLFILTHKVGGLGLNLVGANRVIMIGSNYNPSLDTQSMYRVYRFGQNKKCYIYRLLSMATMEEKIYQRCVVKLHLSGTVVDKLHFVRRYTSSDLRELYKVDFSEYAIERPIPAVPTDKLLALLLQNTAAIYRYHLHNSLLENRPEEELTDEDKKMAWEEFNNMEEAARANATTLVPNPMNNNTRGFLPRALLPNGMRPQLSNRPPHPHNAQQNAFMILFNQSLPSTSAQSPNVTVVRPSVNVVPNRFRTNCPPTQLLQNLRENIAQVLREQPRPLADEAPSAEFNYALNKVV